MFVCPETGYLQTHPRNAIGEEGMSRRDHHHELEEQAESAGYGGATEGVGSGTPPQEQQQPHLQEAQGGDGDHDARAAEADRTEGASPDESR